MLVAGATYGYYKHQPALYSASTQLDLSSGSEARQLVNGTPGRTQLSSPHARRRRRADHLQRRGRSRPRAPAREHIHSKGLGKVHAKASSESDLVTINAEAGSAKGAARLANDYALAYLAQQRSSYRREIEAAIASTRRQLRRIEAAQAASASAAQHRSSAKGPPARGGAAAGGSAVIQAASLASKINQLESELSVSSIQQINPATAQDRATGLPQAETERDLRLRARASCSRRSRSS